MEKRAKDILFKSYWGPAGWLPPTQCSTTPAEFEFAKDAGLMFDPLHLDHAQLVAKAFSARSLATLESVANAFVSSLSNRRLDWRSALGSYALLRHFPRHDYRPRPGTNSCAICGAYDASGPKGEDLSVLNFERLKWGGVRHLQPLYAAFDLELFSKEKIIRPDPDAISILHEIIRQIELAPPQTTASSLEVHLAKALKSNKAERNVIIEIFGICGLLGTKSHPGFLSAFIPESSRSIPARRFVDTGYPACWWTRQDGINQNALQTWFGHLL